jgi:hypothetical protein
VTSTDDVLLNTIGAAAGAGLTRERWRVTVLKIPMQMRRKPVMANARTTVVPRALSEGAFRGELTPADLGDLVEVGPRPRSGQPYYQLVRGRP